MFGMDRDVEQRLAKIGLHVISPHWLASCREYCFPKENVDVAAFDSSSNALAVDDKYNEAQDDEILFQILNTDLRNVIRHHDASTRTPGDITVHHGNNDNVGNQNVVPSKLLRQAIRHSSSQSQAFVVLPESFQLLVQVEELLDVSLNAEDRLTLGPASLTSPTPVGNQKQRCLKMFLSDGYFDNGDWYSRRPCQDPGGVAVNENDGNENDSDDDDNVIRIVAMETEPIPDLSVHSKPGIKVILTGPIEVRLGVLMLHRGNTTVLGGCVPALIPIQKKAMDMAAKLSGVGIDPTYRALVWNPEGVGGDGHGQENDDDDDEGEQESGDLVPQRVVAATAVTTFGTLFNPIATATTRSSVSSSSSGNYNHNAIATPPMAATTATPMAATTATVSSVENPYKRNTRKDVVDHGMDKRTVAPRATPLPLPLPPQQHPERQLQRHFLENVDPVQTSSLQGQSPLHPTTVQENTASLSSTSRTATSTEMLQPRTPAQTTFISNATPSRTRASTLDPYVRQQQQHIMSPTALSEPMSFEELGTLLQRIIVNPEEYRQYEGKVFIVACKYAPPHKKCKKFKGFDIQKRKDYKKLGLEKVSRVILTNNGDD